MIQFAALAVFSGFSLNLLLQLAIGAAGLSGGSKAQNAGGLPLFQIASFFTSVFLIWISYNYVFAFLGGGFFAHFLLFPFSALLCLGSEFLGEKILALIFPRFKGIRKMYSAFTGYDGLVPAALFITMNLAWNAAAAFVLSFFLSIGILAAMIVLNEIRRKSNLEQVPRWLQDAPLVLISMGLLSLVSASAAVIFFRILEIF